MQRFSAILPYVPYIAPVGSAAQLVLSTVSQTMIWPVFDSETDACAFGIVFVFAKLYRRNIEVLHHGVSRSHYYVMAELQPCSTTSTAKSELESCRSAQLMPWMPSRPSAWLLAPLLWPSLPAGQSTVVIGSIEATQCHSPDLNKITSTPA